MYSYVDTIPPSATSFRHIGTKIHRFCPSRELFKAQLEVIQKESECASSRTLGSHTHVNNIVTSFKLFRQKNIFQNFPVDRLLSPWGFGISFDAHG